MTAPVQPTTTLLDDVAAFREQAAAAVPGRLGPLLADRVARLHGDADAPPPPADLSQAERIVLEMTEQFVVDVHEITDDIFTRLRIHFDDAEIVAVMFHIACLDGFGKLEAVRGSALPSPKGTSR